MSDDFDDMNPREMIEAIRGGVPSKCDFCGREVSSEMLEPEEGGEWVCWPCQFRWEITDNKKLRERITLLEAKIADYERRLGKI